MTAYPPKDCVGEKDAFRPVTYLSKLQMISKLRESTKIESAMQKSKIWTRFFQRRKVSKKSGLLPIDQNSSVRSIIFLRTMNYIAWIYIAYDVINRCWNNRVKSPTQAFKIGLDTISWHILASFLFPELILGGILRLSKQKLERLFVRKSTLIFYISVAIAFASLPLIIKPIDKLTDLLLDFTSRSYFDINSPHHSNY